MQLVVKSKKYLLIKKQLWMAQLFTRYKNKDCTKEEIQSVITFMKTPLSSFIKERLTSEEQEEASYYLSKLETIEELQIYQEEKQKDYHNLSIVEAYILFEAKEKLYQLELAQKNKFRK